LFDESISGKGKFWSNKYGGSGVMVDPSLHPQHMNGLKHFYMYGVDVGIGSHSMWVWGGASSNEHEEEN
jgi:hypothetical protein